jgi:hypothetical protein
VNHAIISDRTMLGQRSVTCSCGNVASGGAYDKIADRNHAFHVTQVRIADIRAEQAEIGDLMPTLTDERDEQALLARRDVLQAELAELEA